MPVKKQPPVSDKRKPIKVAQKEIRNKNEANRAAIALNERSKALKIKAYKAENMSGDLALARKLRAQASQDSTNAREIQRKYVGMSRDEAKAEAAKNPKMEFNWKKGTIKKSK